VPYTYRIGKFDITNAQYSAFLNAVARSSDPYVLYDPCMDRSTCYGEGNGIVRTGTAGNYVYAPQPGRALRPVSYVNLFDAMRLANWMNNGQGNASTETGAYTLLGGTPIPTNSANVHRNPGAKIFLPDENEWYKAAYYDPRKHIYYAYPAGTDTPMTCALPGPTPDTGNCGSVTAKDPADATAVTCPAWCGDTTNVGAYTGSPGPYGTFDQGGDLYQWTDDLTFSVVDQYGLGANVAPISDALNSVAGNPSYITQLGPCAIIRGVDWGDSASYNASNARSCDYSFDKFETYGIRLASLPN
jgi:formylglycine-generating enzyme required for sulfatase activity